MSRRLLAHFGPRRGGVRVLAETVRGRPVIMVRWRHQGAPHQRSWPASREARQEATAFARGVADGRAPTSAPAPTVAALWRGYAEAEFPALRPRSQANYAARWRLFEVFAHHDTPADRVDFGHLDGFRAELTRQGYAPNQVRAHVAQVKRVFRWARQRQLLTTAVPDYALKLGKDERTAEPAEYTHEEFVRILGALDPRSAREWRPWAVLMLIGHQGVRANAALHLRWDDLVDGRIVWRRAWDKIGTEDWTQPIRDGALSALETARWWREQEGYTGPWVFPTARPTRRAQVYTPQALAAALWRAERLAGVPHLPLRGVHGLRKMVAGDIYALTGSEKAALDFIHDRDPRVIPIYLKRRPGALDELAARLDVAERERAAVKEVA